MKNGDNVYFKEIKTNNKTKIYIDNAKGKKK